MSNNLGGGNGNGPFEQSASAWVHSSVSAGENKIVIWVVVG